MVEFLLSMNEVKQKYINDENLLWRLLYILFVTNVNKETRDYVLRIFEECKDTFIKIVSKRYSGNDGKYGKSAYVFEYYSIVNNVVRNRRNVENLSELRLFVGNETFYNGVFLKDGWNENAIGGAISRKKLEMMKFLLEIEEIKNECKNNKDELHGILQALCKYYNESIANYVIKELDLTKTIINELTEYKYFDASKILTLL